MHVLLVYPNRPRLTLGAMPGPYGLETVRAGLSEEGIASSIVNPYLSLQPRALLQSSLGPDTRLIGLSLRNLDDALTLWDPTAAGGAIQTESCLPDYEETIRWLRDLAPGVPIALGGAAFGHMPRPLLERLGADAGFITSGDGGFVALAAAMASGAEFGEALRQSPGAVWLEGNDLAAAAGVPPQRERPPVVEREAVYFRFRAEAPVRTYTGCPLRCAHCIEHVDARHVQKSPLGRVLAEMVGVVAHYPEVRRFFLADSEVNLAGLGRTLELVGQIRSLAELAGIPLVGYFNPRPAGLELIGRLARGGCEMRFTVDHAADAILRRNGKNFGASDVRALMRHHADLGLPFSFSLLLGQPGETRDTVDEVLRFIDSIPEAISAPIYFSPGVRIYPGTPIAHGIANGALDRRWIVGPGRDDPDFVEPAVYCERWRPRELFDYVTARAGDRIKPMNPYLRGLGAEGKAQLDVAFQRFYVGLANRGADDATALDAWSGLVPDPRFMSPRQHREFLWHRGLMALREGRPELADDDWSRLLGMVAAADAAPPLLAHNIGVARAMRASAARPATPAPAG